jgi:hypothetical protein
MQVKCDCNYLKTLSLPAATVVCCRNDELTSLSLPSAIKLRCLYNKLDTLSLSAATDINCFANVSLSTMPTLSNNVKRVNMHGTDLSVCARSLPLRLSGRLAPLLEEKHDASSALSLTVILADKRSIFCQYTVEVRLPEFHRTYHGFCLLFRRSRQ